MQKIMIVEDDEVISSILKKHLSKWNYEIYVVENFENILDDFIQQQPILVLLDISLPFYNGYHWCQEIRKISEVPVIFISSMNENMNIVMAMNMGADDFISKPFDQSVLMAKVQAMLRRTYNFSSAVPVIEHNGALLNTGSNMLVYNDKNIELTKNEYKILLVLMENKSKVVSRERLMEVLWETDSFIDENTLTVNVGRLRKKLEAAGLNDFIKTKFGVGYIVG